MWQALAFSKHLVVRTAGDPRAVAAAVQRELRAIDPTVAVENVQTWNKSAAIRWLPALSPCSFWWAFRLLEAS